MPCTRAELLFRLAQFVVKDKSPEMVASFAGENRLATVIGTKTAGNVLGASNFKVGSGYWLRVPVFGWYTSQGNCLEGKGVMPDITVEVEPLLLSSRVDQQMEDAAKVVSKLGRRASGSVSN